MVVYINNIIWRFIDHKPDEYRLLDVRHNIMRSLILGDSDHLIKFILFGNEESDNDNMRHIHIPRSIMWKKDPFESRNDKSKPMKTVPNNDLELAIYHCKGNVIQAFVGAALRVPSDFHVYFIGRELKDTIIVAYLLEYYSRHAKESAGWMCTVSKALPLLYKYHYGVFLMLYFRMTFVYS